MRNFMRALGLLTLSGLLAGLVGCGSGSNQPTYTMQQRQAAFVSALAAAGYVGARVQLDQDNPKDPHYFADVMVYNRCSVELDEVFDGRTGVQFELDEVQTPRKLYEEPQKVGVASSKAKLRNMKRADVVRGLTNNRKVSC